MMTLLKNVADFRNRNVVLFTEQWT